MNNVVQDRTPSTAGHATPAQFGAGNEIRIRMLGLVEYATTLSSMQGYLNGLGMGRNERFNNAYFPEYSLTNSFPSTTHANVLSYTYYDNYSWTGWYGPVGSKDNSFDSYFPAPSNSVYPYPQPLTEGASAKPEMSEPCSRVSPSLSSTVGRLASYS